MTARRVLLAIGSMGGGGSERQLLSALEHLDRKRFAPELYVIYPGGELFEKVPADVPVHIFSQRCAITGWSAPGAVHRARARDMAHVLRERSIDVVYDRTFHMTLTTAGATQVRPTPRVSVIVSDPQHDLEANLRRFRPVKRWLLRRAYREADVVGTVSDCVRARAIDYYHLYADKVQTLYNFFDVHQLDTLARARAPDNLARREGRFRIVAVGRLHPDKGFDVLVEALRLVIYKCGQGRVELVILGSGVGEAALRRQIHAAGLEDHVQLAGYQANPLPIVREADLFCLPSRFEGMPNALVEALWCGVPVVASDCYCGPREILQDGRLGCLVPTGDAQQLAAAIDDAVLHPATWRSKSVEARDYIQSTFAVQAGIDRVMHVLDDAIERFRRRT